MGTAYGNCWDPSGASSTNGVQALGWQGSGDQAVARSGKQYSSAPHQGITAAGGDAVSTGLLQRGVHL